MSNNISKALKNKTDAQLRLLEQDAAPIVRESVSGDNFISDPNEYSQGLLAGKNITITTAGNNKTINAVMGILSGDNISISEADEDGKVTIKGTLSGKDINIDDFVDKDGYVLSYDETGNQFILTEASSGGSLTQATETELGGIKAKEKTSEASEVAIDPITGKLYTGAFEPFTTGGVKTENFEDDVYIFPITTILNGAGAFAGRSSAYKYEGISSYLVQIDVNGSSIITNAIFYLDFPTEGALRFFYKTVAENSSYGPIMSISIDGITIISTKNSIDWTLYEISLSEGLHTLKVQCNGGSWARLAQIFIDELSMPNDITYNQAIDQHSKIDKIAKNPDMILASKSDGTGLEYISKGIFKAHLSGDALPMASDNLRGQIFTLHGGAGVADASYICQKDASDAYIWQQI